MSGKDYNGHEVHSPESIKLGQQIDEMDRLLSIAAETLTNLEENLTPVMKVDPPSMADGEKGADEPGHLSPYQQRMMDQYNRLNYLVGRIDGINRRVQL